MSSEEHKAIVRRFFNAFAANDQATLETLLAPDLVAYLPGDLDPVTHDVFLDIVRRWNTAFSDLQFTLEQQIAEGDTVANRITLQGVHNRGDFLGLPPTDKPIAIRLITTERITNGRIVERWVVFDLLDLMQQLGATSM
jgi:steroid delta-isomerase-like uncharacterized protein